MSAWLRSLSREGLLQVLYSWDLWARPKQRPPPGLWKLWLLLAGRGFGKTKSGAEWVRSVVDSGRVEFLALVGPTATDIRQTMIEGPSGILNVFPPWQRPQYIQGQSVVRFHNGVKGLCYSADAPERLRGPNLGAAWADELCAWRTEDTWKQLMLCLRAGAHPQVCVTTTPRPTKQILRLLERAVAWDGERVFDKETGEEVPVPTSGTVVTSGSSYENRANLADGFFSELQHTFEGTRLGRQEIYAELLTDADGALFRLADIDKARVQEAPEFERIVVAVDPAPSSGENSDLTGVVVAGKRDDHAYALEDLSIKDTPDNWARVAISAYYRHRADCVVVERNRGGDMVKALIQTIDDNVPVKEVTAMRSKYKRAEPVGALYEQGRIHHVGYFEKLEKQMISFTGEAGRRDDRCDTLCWAIHELLLAEAAFALV